MRGQLLTGLVLVLLALALAGALVGAGSRPDLPEGEVRVAAFTPDAVRVVAAPGRFTLTREGEAWRVRGPGVDGVADPIAVGRLLAALRGAAHGLPVEGDPADFGLADPAVLVVDGVRLEVGDAAPVGERTYVTRPDGGVAAVPGRLAELARADAASWIEDHAVPTP